MTSYKDNVVGTKGLERYKESKPRLSRPQARRAPLTTTGRQESQKVDGASMVVLELCDGCVDVVVDTL